MSEKLNNFRYNLESIKEKLNLVPGAVITLVKSLPATLIAIPGEIIKTVAELKNEFAVSKSDKNLRQQLLESIRESVGPYPLDPIQMDLLNHSHFLEPARTANGAYGRERLQVTGILIGTALALTPGLHPVIGLSIVAVNVADMARNILLQSKTEPTNDLGGVITTH